MYKILEALPRSLRAALDDRARAIDAIGVVNRNAASYVLRRSALWQAGQRVRVAFQGGDRMHCLKIAQAADEWTEHANIDLDFHDSLGRFHRWSNNDTGYAAEIRISFDPSGYWSLLGRDSVDPSIVQPYQASMNLQGFQHGLPPDWRTTVLHEFGHALGFEHEHQSPAGGFGDQIRWEDDSGYTPIRNHQGEFVTDPDGRSPGVYTVLGGPPNNWDREKVDRNLRPLTHAHAYLAEAFDPQSIMKYSFEPWMYRDGVASPFYGPPNSELSAGDKAGAARAYPASDQDLRPLSEEHFAAARQLLARESGLGSLRLRIANLVGAR